MNVAAKIRDLYEQNPDAIDTYRHQNPYSWWEASVSLIDKNPLHNFSSASLDSYFEKSALNMILSSFSAEILCSELGEDALLWTWLNKSRSIFDEDNLIKDIERITGLDSMQIDKISTFTKVRLNTSGVGLFKKNYDANSKSVGNYIESLNLQEYLKNSTKNNFQFSQKRLNDYSLSALSTQGAQIAGHDINWNYTTQMAEEKMYIIFLDSLVGLSLNYKDKPNAVIGFYPCDLETIFVEQLQGIRPMKYNSTGCNTFAGSSKGLIPGLNWKKLLVDIVFDFAKEIGFSQIAIQSGYNNYWTKPSHFGDPLLPLENAIKIYDDFAKESGFKKGKYDNWYKEIRN
jgi:hypothetical protein